jgi:UDP-N-acetylmuramyl tripeptide synthase
MTDNTELRRLIDELELIEQPITEVTLEDSQDFHEEYGYLAYCEEGLFEAEYQGRTVKLNKPSAGDVKKFKVYVKNDKGNVVKVNFGQKGVRIKKSNPGKRKNFRARHNCDNPGPKHKARYWSCRKW